MKILFKNSTGLLLAIVAILISVNFAQAQQRGQQGTQQGPPPLPNELQIEKMVTDLSNELSLSDEQEKKISALYFTHFEEAGKLRAKHEKERNADREKMEKFREDFEAEVKANLNDEQKDQFDAFQKKQFNCRNNKGKKGNNKGRPRQ